MFNPRPTGSFERGCTFDAARATTARRSPKHIREIRDMEARLERALMTCHAMWLARDAFERLQSTCFTPARR
ncbi:MAG: hypothetical protein C4547_03210 [Phycisphaerales bacterium]|nr:MAG: hypothetical protein C4547_03210 [Phycisphaerales bacterium]